MCKFNQDFNQDERIINEFNYYYGNKEVSRGELYYIISTGLVEDVVKLDNIEDGDKEFCKDFCVLPYNVVFKNGDVVKIFM